MAAQTLGVIGKSSSKLATEKAELKTELETSLKGYVDSSLTSQLTLCQKMIEGKVANFSLPSGVTEIKDYLLYNTSYLKTVDITNCSRLGEYAFAKCYYVNSIDTSNAVIDRLGVGAFSRIGCDRDRPDLNLITIDLRKSKFKFVGKHAFGGDDIDHRTRYAEIYIPKSVDQVANYAFRLLDHCNIYFDGMAPQLFGSAVFSEMSNSIIYVSWRGLYGYKHNTNWSSLNTIGFGSKNDFAAGEILPAYTQDGYALTWYSDVDMLHPATTADGVSHYYCNTTATEKTASRITTRIEHCSLTFSDGTNTYDEDHPIPHGTTVTITVTPDTGFGTKFALTVNGVAINSGDTITAASGTEFAIVALYYDGVNVPVNPILNENSPEVIANVCRAGKALDYWNLGDELSMTLSDGVTIVFQLVDTKTGRYDYSQTSNKTNAVFMAKKIHYSAQMNPSNTNVGGFAAMSMNLTYLPALFNKMSPAWKAVIPEVEVKSAYSGTSGTLATATCHLFLPSGYEVSGGSFNGRGEEIDDVFGFYQGKGNADRIKYNTSNQAAIWWLRSPYSGNTSLFVYVTAAGAAGGSNASNTYGVVPCFAI